MSELVSLNALIFVVVSLVVFALCLTTLAVSEYWQMNVLTGLWLIVFTGTTAVLVFATWSQGGVTRFMFFSWIFAVAFGGSFNATFLLLVWLGRKETV